MAGELVMTPNCNTTYFTFVKHFIVPTSDYTFLGGNNETHQN